MKPDRLIWRTCTAVALASAVLPFLCLETPVARAQGFMRSPTIRVESRVNIGPRINPNVGSRVNPNIAGRVNPNIAGRVGVNSVAIGRVGDHGPHVSILAKMGSSTSARIGTAGSGLAYVRYSPSLYPVCEYAYRGPDGDCYNRPVALIEDGGSGKRGKGKSGAGRNNGGQAAVNLSSVRNEFVAEIDGNLTEAEATELGRRHGLIKLASQNFPLLGATIGLFRIADNRSAEEARREFAADASVRSVQPNYRYILQDQKTPQNEGDPAQYALAQLRLPQAHTLSHGMNVTVAVIDSGIDAAHPELINSISDAFDALGSKEGPHVHGTGIAGAIAAHAKLMGSAPEVRILAIRAFGAASSGAESTSYVILKSLDYAALHGAQIINMSFAGPKDSLIERGVAATAAKGIVLVAAAGNAGAKSPPLYPAANPNVIAVSGTDAKDKLFNASNRGNHIALAAPGADILLPAPDGKYQMTSGTSFSAAYVSGIAALLLERNPALKPGDVRAILTNTARDLGPPGPDDQFGAGEADAFAAVTAAISAPAVPMASATDKPSQPPKAPDNNNTSVSRALDDSAPAMAADKSSGNRATAR